MTFRKLKTLGRHNASANLRGQLSSSSSNRFENLEHANPGTPLDRFRRSWKRRAVLLTCGLLSATSVMAVISHSPANSSAATLSRDSVSVPHFPPAMVAAVMTTPTIESSTSTATLAASTVKPTTTLATKPTTSLPLAAGVIVPPASTGGELLRDATSRSAKQAKTAEPRRQIIWMYVTAYCPCSKCCGEDAQGVTASGKSVNYNRGHFVAADTNVLPFGTKLSIPGYHNGNPVEVIDRGGAIRGNKLDVYFPNHSTAKQWGKRRIPVVIYADDE